MASIAAGAAAGVVLEKRIFPIIFAASLGTVFEWYDFFLYGSLATNIGAHFFTAISDPNTRFIFSLLAFAAGFVVRPFGALIFGRLGDLAGRKHTFLITILIMGASTFLVGLLPDYGSIGVASPILLTALRLAQGLALGGEYGGAAIYVAEHAPGDRRGFYTSWIQTTATFGLLLSIIVIVTVQSTMSEATFASIGWRIPFLVSILLLAVSVFIRMRLNESPVFQQMKAEGRTAKSPLKEAFGEPKNLRLVLIALFGLSMGQAVLWYCGQFYVQIFLTKTLLMAPLLANELLAVALALSIPFFVAFGRLSDLIGRKKLVLAGCLLGCTTYFPIFAGLAHFGNPALEHAIQTMPVTLQTDTSSCSIQFNPIGTAKFLNPCDIAASSLMARGVPFKVENSTGDALQIAIGGTPVEGIAAGQAAADFKSTLDKALDTAGYPRKADPAAVDRVGVVLLMTLLIIYAAMIYGPIAAILVELFPARIRYSAMSLPYHIGNGWFGGLLPATVVAIVAATGDVYAGLWYPIIVSGLTVVIGAIFLPETRGRPID